MKIAAGDPEKQDKERLCMMSLLYIQSFLKKTFADGKDLQSLEHMMENLEAAHDSLDIVFAKGKRARVKAGSPTTTASISSNVQKMINVCKCIIAILGNKVELFQEYVKVLFSCRCRH